MARLMEEESTMCRGGVHRTVEEILGIAKVGTLEKRKKATSTEKRNSRLWKSTELHQRALSTDQTMKVGVSGKTSTHLMWCGLGAVGPRDSHPLHNASNRS